VRTRNRFSNEHERYEFLRTNVELWEHEMLILLGRNGHDNDPGLTLIQIAMRDALNDIYCGTDNK